MILKKSCDFKVVKELNGYEKAETQRKEFTKKNKRYSRGFTISDLTKDDLETFRSELNNLMINNS